MKQAISNNMDVLQSTGMTLSEDEHILDTAVIHGAIFWKGVAVAIIGILMLPFFTQNLGILLIFVGFIMIGIAYLTQKNLVLFATDKRIVIRSGFVYTDIIELRYTQVESIEVGMTPIGQILGYGNVVITGTGQRRVIVPFVSNAIGFRKAVNDALIDK